MDVEDVPGMSLGSIAGVVEVPGLISGSDSPGFGHVTSLQFSGQNSRILLKRYHCLARDSPVGVTHSVRSVADGAQSSLRSFISTPRESLFSHTKTEPLWLLENRKWWKDFIPTHLADVL